MLRILLLVRRPVLAVRLVRLLRCLCLNRSCWSKQFHCSGHLSAPDQPSPEFLATVVQAVKQALAADQAPVSQVNRPGTCGLAVCAASATSCSFGGVSGLAFGLQASAFLTACSGFSSQSSVAQSPSSSGSPAFVVPSFVSTFAP